MSTVLWVTGFVLMMGSFSFLFAKREEPDQPRISVEPPVFELRRHRS